MCRLNETSLHIARNPAKDIKKVINYLISNRSVLSHGCICAKKNSNKF